MNAPLSWIVAASLLAVALLASARLWRRQARIPQSRGRLWLLIAAQPLLAGLLYPVLLPPAGNRAVGTLHVATAGTPAAQVAAGDAESWIALPEAPALAGVARVPDLATALRRAPGTTQLVIHGHGLPARDRDRLAVPLRLALTAPPTGLVALAAPPPVPAGQRLTVGARVQGLPGARVDLLDPGGQVVDSGTVGADGLLRLRGLARAPGQMQFALRLRDTAGNVRDQLDVPLVVTASVPLRGVLLAGAPQPELKYLRRWADDAGLELRSQIAVGPGMQLGEAAALDATSLDRLDLLVIDQRRLLALGESARQTVRAAIGRGLGVLVRLDGPVDARIRTALAALGLTTSGGEDSRPVAAPLSLAAAGNAAAVPAGDAPPLPPLQRSSLQPQQPDAMAAVRADDGSALGWWRAAGRGRIGVSVVADSFTLVLAGRSDLHAALWAQLFASVARAHGPALPAVQAGWAQQRMTLCGLSADAVVIAPDGTQQALLLDRAAGANGNACAGYWPAAAGWHRLQSDTGERWLHVRTPQSAPTLYAQQLREATLALAANRTPATSAAMAPAAGARWPWLLAWLVLASALWGLERRPAPPTGARNQR
ncbi:carboxypeptidase regulatory-like domain-containing protein [Xanthomonas maliensis]|uniref:carboxypeptidase regulatory-like domain-containing protein n=1 Tax=Xanthomonas maliensis TaxID=1321368 RepID=UPI001264EBF8|nr:carboxypeptidase regulatory-like domain-containing protein [Xanthomonas maliensis]KAB7762159.1 hypothetical protein CKY51_21890 [Xanthomonas maliensis]